MIWKTATTGLPVILDNKSLKIRNIFDLQHVETSKKVHWSVVTVVSMDWFVLSILLEWWAHNLMYQQISCCLCEHNTITPSWYAFWCISSLFSIWPSFQTISRTKMYCHFLELYEILSKSNDNESFTCSLLKRWISLSNMRTCWRSVSLLNSSVEYLKKKSFSFTTTNDSSLLDILLYSVLSQSMKSPSKRMLKSLYDVNDGLFVTQIWRLVLHLLNYIFLQFHLMPLIFQMRKLKVCLRLQLCLNHHDKGECLS